jgi:hypothetical protein
MKSLPDPEMKVLEVVDEVSVNVDQIRADKLQIQADVETDGNGGIVGGIVVVEPQPAERRAVRQTADEGIVRRPSPKTP